MWNIEKNKSVFIEIFTDITLLSPAPPPPDIVVYISRTAATILLKIGLAKDYNAMSTWANNGENKISEFLNID